MEWAGDNAFHDTNIVLVFTKFHRILNSSVSAYRDENQFFSLVLA